MKIAQIAVLILFVTALVFAEGDKSLFNGNEYLSLTDQQKLWVIDSFIQSGREKGIMIKKGAKFYAKKIDDFYKMSPESLGQSFLIVLKSLMITENDWQ